MVRVHHNTNNMRFITSSIRIYVFIFVSKSFAAPVAEKGETVGQVSLTRGQSVIEVSPSLRNVFPAANFNRNVSVPWWSTDVLSKEDHTKPEATLASLEQAQFIVFNADFYEVLGINSYQDEKTVEKVFEFPPGPSFSTRNVHDGTVYSPECNCIFLAELHPPKPGFSADAMPWIWRVSLNASTPVVEKVYPRPQLTVGNGAFYHNGSVYWAQEGNYTVPGGVVRMDPLTLETEVVLNNFLGHRFNSPNDIVISRSGIAFFTDGYYGFDNFNDTLKPELANGVWRWDMHTGDVRQVAGAGTGIWLNPNGLALSPDEQYLYVTARGKTSADADGQRTVYRFEIASPSSGNIPLLDVNIFAYADAGFPDGIKVDEEGRIYGGVTGGVDVWSQNGELLGKINVVDGDVAVNMQWVDNWMYIAGRSFLYRVQLTVKGA
jgi:gluconolactonase